MDHAALRVLLVDDNAHVRANLRSMLSSIDDFQIVGEAVDGQQAVDLARRLMPDVVLMDLEMPRRNGYEAATHIKWESPSLRVVALTIHDDEVARRRATQAGIDAFVVKGGSLDDLLEAIRG